MNERLERVVEAQIARAARKFGPDAIWLRREDGRRLRVVAIASDGEPEPETFGNATVYRRRRIYVVAESTWRSARDFVGGDDALRRGETFIEEEGGTERKFRPDVPASSIRFGGGFARRIECVQVEESQR
ncbi:MAG: hypothetical protein IJO46_00545 [Thermoguttaceae bacterium]|nr:hypothetical protein [Thermoguttaceae bacterium]